MPEYKIVYIALDKDGYGYGAASEAIMAEITQGSPNFDVRKAVLVDDSLMALLDTGDVAKHCPSCGRPMTKANPHTMCKSKVRVLYDICVLNDRGHGLVKPPEGGEGLLKLPDGSTYKTVNDCKNHIHRLTWFGLLDRISGRRTGGYRINENGREFLSGNRSIPKTIFCRDGEVIWESPETIYVNEVSAHFTDEYWASYAAHQVRVPPRRSPS
jgi:hypothetical protein